MDHRSFARFLAPLALVAVAVALVLVIGGSQGDDSSATTQAPATTRTAPAKKRAKDQGQSSARAATYRVQPGDTLQAIAAKTGVDVDVLQQLNPGVNPAALRVGQQLKLKP